jgi:hypothetical protein
MTTIPIPSQCARPAAHVWYEARLPELTRRCRAFTYRLPRFVREEAQAEILAGIFEYLLSAERRGKLHALTPFSLVSFFGRAFCGGRRVAGSSRTDVMSSAAQRRRGFRVVSLETMELDPSSDRFVRLADVLANSKADLPLERARRNIDYPEILERQQASPKAKRVFEFLCQTACAGKQVELASELGVSQPRITQLKHELADRLAEEGYFPAGFRPRERVRPRKPRRRGSRSLREIPLNAGTSPAWRGPK